MLPVWPEFPEIMVQQADDGGITMTGQDRQRIIVWIDQVERIHDSLDTCDQVKFVPPDELLP